MIRLTTTRSVRTALPIRTTTPVSLTRTQKVPGRGGTGRRTAKHRSVETVFIVPGQPLERDDSWADLDDVRKYLAQGLLTIESIQE